MFFIQVTRNTDLPLYTLPNVLWIRSWAFLFVATSMEATMPFVLGFVVFVGVALLNAQDDLYQLLQ